MNTVSGVSVQVVGDQGHFPLQQTARTLEVIGIFTLSLYILYTFIL